MRVDRAPGYDERRDALAHEYVQWLTGLGHVPFPVPNTLQDPAAYAAALGAEAVILSGGNDLIPIRQRPDAVAPERDRTESTLVKFAIARGMPVFGVCRGLQLLARHFGSSLASSLESAAGAGHVRVRHDVVLSPPFTTLAGTTVLHVNSFHDQGVLRSSLGAPLSAFATAGEVVEGLVHRSLPIAAVQWHPERVGAPSDFDTALLSRLLADRVFWAAAL